MCIVCNNVQFQFCSCFRGCALHHQRDQGGGERRGEKTAASQLPHPARGGALWSQCSGGEAQTRVSVGRLAPRRGGVCKLAFMCNLA